MKTKKKAGSSPHKKTAEKTPGVTSGSNPFQKLIICGTILSTLILSISLCIYYQPALIKKAISSAYSLSASISSSIHTLSDDNKKKLELEEAAAEAASTDETETVPHLVVSQEMGNISDLNSTVPPIGEDSIYSVMLDTSMGSMLYYHQGDRRWADYLYGGADPMKQYGCGPTAVSMLVNSFTPATVTPVELADWAAANGEYAPQGGSYHSLIPASLSHFGLTVESVGDLSYDTATQLLQSGHILVALMGKGQLTNNGHFVLITQLLDNGNVHIADPNSYANSTKEWDLNQLLSELKKSYDSGGPLWAVSF